MKVLPDFAHPPSILIEWLMDGPPWIQFRTRLDLLDQMESDPQVVKARQAMLDDGLVSGLVEELASWPGAVLTSHKSAGHLLHRLSFAAELGLKSSDPQMDRIISRILEHQSPEGPFQVLMNIPLHFGGSGQDQFAWALCDTPLVVYALTKFGLGNEARVQSAAAYLMNLIRDNGWPCAVSIELGKFRGPGRKGDPCPFANLAVLKMLSQLPGWRDSPVSHLGVEAQLQLWEQRREQHPYQFYMGTDFSKLKAPLVWYDILHVLDVLAQYPWTRNDPRMQNMIEIVKSKADELGRFTPESVWTAWKDWEFGQKRLPSRWLTLLVTRALRRLGGEH
jgi:hypothetical protein